MDLSRRVGAMFRAARQAQQLSQEQVADLTEGRLGRAMISSIERGRNLPGLETLAALARVLNIDPLHVLEGIDLAHGPSLELTGLSRDALRARADGLLWAGDYRGALATYTALLEQLVSDPPQAKLEARDLRARTETSRAVALRHLSALRTAQEAAQRAVQSAEGLPALQAEAYLILASVWSQLGLSVLAANAAEHAVALAERGGDARLQAWAWHERGVVLCRALRFADARMPLLEAAALARRAKDAPRRIAVEGDLGTCLGGLGHHARARRHLVLAIALARKHAAPAAEAFWLVELGSLALAAGTLDEADGCARAALQIAKRAEQHLTTFRAEWLRHRVSRARDPQEADRHRLAYLRRLYPRVKVHRGDDAVTAFERTVLTGDQVPIGERLG